MDRGQLRFADAVAIGMDCRAALARALHGWVRADALLAALLICESLRPHRRPGTRNGDRMGALAAWTLRTRFHLFCFASTRALALVSFFIDGRTERSPPET